MQMLDNVKVWMKKNKIKICYLIKKEKKIAKKCVT